MAQFVNIFDIDLQQRNDPLPLRSIIGEGDINGLRVGARVFDGGESVTLGGQCVGYAIRADGTTVPLTGTISSNTAYVVLDQQTCAVAGPLQVAVMWVSGDNVTTLIVAYGTVVNTQTGTVIQPGDPIPDLTELLAEIDAMREATADAEAAATQLAPKIISLYSADATAIPENASMDDYTTPGNYLVANATIAASVTNYPFTVGGRVIVGQTTNAGALAQIVIPNNNAGIVMRARGENTWSEWSTTMKGTLSGAANLDNFTAFSVYAYTPSGIASLTNFPGNLSKSVGGLIVTINSAAILNGRVQFVIPWSTDNTIAKRYYQNSWSAWGYTPAASTTITVGTGGDYTSLVDALDYVTSDALRNTWNEGNRLVIELGAGTFSMNDVVNLYNSDNTRYKWGLYIPRCCTIRGAGMDKTIISYNYDGDDDWILGHISPLNMPYESALENLTIDATNCRYCVHSDGDEPFQRAWALTDNAITVKNVRMVHHGYTDGHVSSYNVPAAWGSGIRSNVSRTFINCEFVAHYMPWFCHNTIGMAKESTIRFDNCTFVNTKTDAAFTVPNDYAGPTFISWGTGIKTTVEMANCYTNRYICIRPSTTYVADADCDYYLYDDGESMIEELKTNDAYLLDTWINRNCIVAVSGASITGFTPVSVNVNGVAEAYSAVSFAHGIATHTCAAGKRVKVQTNGLIDLRLIDVSGFSAGTLLGYSGGTWVADSEHPIIRVINSYVGEIV